MYNKASALLKRMEEDERIKPDVITYTTFLNILARSTNSTKKAKIAETILNMLEKSQDAKMVLNNMTDSDSILSQEQSMLEF